MTTTTDPKQRARELIDQLLLSTNDPPMSPYGLFKHLVHHSNAEAWRLDWRSALEYWGELQRIGVVAVMGSGDHVSAGMPLHVVTTRGRAMLERKASSPHDSDRFIASLRLRVASPDEVAMGYLVEAIGAWKSGLNRASVVMLGCACERIILVLADHVVRVGVEPFSAKLGKMLSPDKPSNISDVFTLVRDAVIAAAEDKRLSHELAPDVVDRRFTPIFERARRLRNRSGHPTGDDIHAEEAEAGLLLFPDFHEFASRVLTELKPRT